MENQDEGLELLDETDEIGGVTEPRPTPIAPPVASPASGLYRWSAATKLLRF